MKTLLIATLALAPLALAAPAAQAAGYTSYATFAAAAGPLQIEDFGSLPVGTTIASGSVIDGIGYSFALSGGATEGYIDNHGSSISGHSLARVGSAFVPNDVITLSFATPVTAAGSFINTALGKRYQASIGGVLPLTASTTPTTAYDRSTFIFLGIVSPTAFSTVAFTGGTTFSGVPSAFWGSPEIVFAPAAAPVPEPATAHMLLLAGLAGLGWRLRGRSRIGCPTDGSI